VAGGRPAFTVKTGAPKPVGVATEIRQAAADAVLPQAIDELIERFSSRHDDERCPTRPRWCGTEELNRLVSSVPAGPM
jgi:hypothetical protein